MASLILLLLTSSVSAAYPTSGFGRQCKNLTIPVTVSANLPQFKSPLFNTNLNGSAYALEMLTRNVSADLMTGFKTVSGTYNISASFCYPSAGISDAPVQILTHGAGFDKVYWDFPHNNYNYSWVQTAVNTYGYNTLAIDRLGIGNSSHGDPLNEIQATLELEALHQVTLAVRNNKLPGINKAGGFKKVVHVGHSFGSVLSYALSAKYPESTDGVILTGYSTDFEGQQKFLASWDVRPARLNQPFRFGSHSTGKGFKGDFLPAIQGYLKTLGIDFSSSELWNDIAETEVGNLIVGLNDTSGKPLNYPGGYLTWPALTNNIVAFLLPGYFDVGLAVYSEQTKQPTAIGELITIASAPLSSPFTGPVLVLTGRQDLPFCNGDCLLPDGTTRLDGVKKQYPNVPANKFRTVVHPNTGHGMTAHFNATGGYKVANDFLKANALGAKL